MKKVARKYGRRYPWVKWFKEASRRPLTLWRFRDYNGGTHNMGMVIRRNIKQRFPGYRPSIKLAPDNNSLTLTIIKTEAQ